VITVQSIDHLGNDAPERIMTLDALFNTGHAVTILEGAQAGKHTERSFLLDLAVCAVDYECGAALAYAH